MSLIQTSQGHFERFFWLSVGMKTDVRKQNYCKSMNNTLSLVVKITFYILLEYYLSISIFRVATPATQDKSVDQVASGIANVTSKSGTKRKAAFTPPVTPSASVTALMMGTKKIPAPLHTPINASVLVSEKAQLTPATTLTCKSATERGYILKENGKRIYFCPECNQKEETPMIGCDKCDRWYHFDCVGIEEEPPKEENWYCYTCSV